MQLSVSCFKYAYEDCYPLVCCWMQGIQRQLRSMLVHLLNLHQVVGDRIIVAGRMLANTLSVAACKHHRSGWQTRLFLAQIICK
ncbi:MAG TPA: hypothetical protein V6C91_02445 [Coleofasciculaceae cyanobacterium]